MKKSQQKVHIYRINGKAILGMVFLLLPGWASAQYAIEALRFSRLNPAGTARYAATGGAFSAIGADFTNISTNPAGLALFRSSQATITPALYIATSNSYYQGNKYDDDRFNVNLGNLGLVFKIRYNKTKTTGIQFLNLAVGYSRIQNFNRSLYFQGTNSTHSLADVFLNNAQGTVPAQLDAFREQLAFNSYLIDTTSSGPTNYLSNGMQAGQDKLQSLQITTKGSGGEYTAAGSVNIANRIFLGASFALVRLSFDEVATYSESDPGNVNPVFNDMHYQEKLQVRGTGINLKVGAIGRPVDWLRIGFAFHTPTWYSMDENYTNTMQTSLSFGNFNATSPIGRFEYNLNTPWRIQASLGFVIEKYVLIGAEYEFVDYRTARLRPNQSAFLGPNTFIDTSYVQTHSFKIGAEGRLDPFRLRIGYNRYMNPFKGGLNLDATVQHISTGVGYKSKKWFSFDLTYVAIVSRGIQYINSSFTGIDPATVKNLNHNILFTFGFSF